MKIDDLHTPQHQARALAGLQRALRYCKDTGIPVPTCADAVQEAYYGKAAITEEETS
jgi:hypothetical protein